MADASPMVVELRGARKRFGEIEAVKGVDLAIGPG
jgi:ABC-type sugar transport system ATPase subunit